MGILEGIHRLVRIVVVDPYPAIATGTCERPSLEASLSGRVVGQILHWKIKIGQTVGAVTSHEGILIRLRPIE